MLLQKHLLILNLQLDLAATIGVLFIRSLWIAEEKELVHEIAGTLKYKEKKLCCSQSIPRSVASVSTNSYFSFNYSKSEKNLNYLFQVRDQNR